MDVEGTGTSGPPSGPQHHGARDEAAFLRETAVAAREVAARDRERVLVLREGNALEREASVLHREVMAVRRDDLGAARDSRAEARDTDAAERDVSAGDRDATALRTEHAEDSELTASTRVVMVATRALAATDRASAAIDRVSSLSDRDHARADRSASAADRQASSDERATDRIDELTGALLRGPGAIDLEREIRLARLAGQDLVMGFVDVVGLKGVNDRLGHSAGDLVLSDVVAALRAHIRPGDPIVRQGGDEFVCLLTGLQTDGARGRLAGVHERLRTREPPVAITIGLVTMGPDDTVDTLIARADADLYRQRSNGTSGP